MQAILLAAGQGTRLRPHTNDRPKCLVRLRGRTLLERQLAVLKQCGVTDITVIGGYRHEMIAAAHPEVRLVVNEKFAATNMVATFYKARELFAGGRDIIVSYADIVYEPRVLEAVLDCARPVCLAANLEWRKLWDARMEDPLSDAETFVTDADGRVLDLGKKAESFDQVHAQYMGLFKVRGDFAARLGDAYDAMDRSATYDGKDFENMYMTSLIHHLITKGWHVQAVPVPGGWLEVDSAEDLECYESMYTNGRLDELCRLG